MRQTTTQQTLSSYTLTVTDVLLAGQTISAVDGCTVTINSAAPALPHTLAVGEVLAVTHGLDRTHPSGFTLLGPELAIAAGGSVARLSRTQGYANQLPYAGSSGITVRQYENGIYPKALLASFTTVRALPIEGFRIIADGGLIAAEIDYAELSDSLGNVIDLGTFSAAADPLNPGDTLVLGKWSSPRMLAPGSYSLNIAWKAGTSSSVVAGKAGQTLGAGMTAFVGRRASGNDLVIGLRFNFTTGPASVVGQLDLGGMRVVAAETAIPDWYNGALEVVAAPAAAPYLRTRHEGNDYRLDFVLVPPAGAS